MNTIKVKVIPPETIEVFGPDGSSYGKLNELEFLDLRCQIKKLKKRGFYIYYEGEKIMIGKNGLLEKYTPIFTSNLVKYNYLLNIDNDLYMAEVKNND